MVLTGVSSAKVTRDSCFSSLGILSFESKRITSTQLLATRGWTESGGGAWPVLSVGVWSWEVPDSKVNDGKLDGIEDQFTGCKWERYAPNVMEYGII